MYPSRYFDRKRLSKPFSVSISFIRRRSSSLERYETDLIDFRRVCSAFLLSLQLNRDPTTESRTTVRPFQQSFYVGKTIVRSSKASAIDGEVWGVRAGGRRGRDEVVGLGSGGDKLVSCWTPFCHSFRSGLAAYVISSGLYVQTEGRKRFRKEVVKGIAKRTRPVLFSVWTLRVGSHLTKTLRITGCLHLSRLREMAGGLRALRWTDRASTRRPPRSCSPPLTRRGSPEFQ